MGLVPINLTSQVKEGQQQQFVYPYALVHYKGQALPVTLYQGKNRGISNLELNSAEAMLEFNLAKAVSKALQTQKTSIGYSIGNGEPKGVTIYDLVENNLNVDYKLSTINLNSQPFVPKEFKVLVIVKPTQTFTEQAKLKLDQYVMNGGKILLFVDRLNAEMDSLQIKNEVVAYDRDLQLNDLLFKYGARVNADLMMDMQCDDLPFDLNGNGQFELLPWNYFPVLASKENHPINKNLGFVSARFINSIDTVEA
ncbi:MAG: gliding motility-associated ABC transporter substrate-binding protein GldG, partial [Chitinophagaceae bacterium]